MQWTPFEHVRESDEADVQSVSPARFTSAMAMPDESQWFRHAAVCRIYSALTKPARSETGSTPERH